MTDPDPLRVNLNREQRRALGETADNKLTLNITCKDCLDYLAAHDKQLRDDCAQVGIEAGLLPDQALFAFFQGFHKSDHSTEVTKAAATEAASDEAQATNN